MESSSETTFEAAGAICWADAITGLVAVSLWIVLFLGGSLISTAAARQLMGQDPLGHILAWAVVLAFYTLTNVALLCLLSSIMGGLYKHLTKKIVGGRLKLLPYVIQGFVVYMLLVSGMLVFSDEPFVVTSPSKYIRLAATASAFSFMAGFNPKIFTGMLEKLEKR